MERTVCFLSIWRKLRKGLKVTSPSGQRPWHGRTVSIDRVLEREMVKMKLSNFLHWVPRDNTWQRLILNHYTLGFSGNNSFSLNIAKHLQEISHHPSEELLLPQAAEGCGLQGRLPLLGSIQSGN